MEPLQAWIGRQETHRDVADPRIYQKLASVLDHQDPPWRERQAPPLGHWLNFLANVRQSDLGEDGHPKRGGFLPPVELPRRMWAGSRVQFPGTAPIGSLLERRSTIMDVAEKTGRSGAMVFVTVRHEIYAGDALAIIEEQDIVYREAPKEAGGATTSQPGQPRPSDWSRTIHPDSVLLFRFSALTYNSHRIHYDADYARQEEGYPALVVHGPLTATLLMDHYLRRRPKAEILSFSFRAQSPLFHDAPFELHGKETSAGVELWAAAPGGSIAMNARIEVA